MQPCAIFQRQLPRSRPPPREVLAPAHPRSGWSRKGVTTSRVSLLGTMGIISNVTPTPRQLSIDSCRSRRSSQRISWKQRAKVGSTQLSTYSRPAGSIRPASRTRRYTGTMSLPVPLKAVAADVGIVERCQKDDVITLGSKPNHLGHARVCTRPISLKNSEVTPNVTSHALIRGRIILCWHSAIRNPWEHLGLSRVFFSTRLGVEHRSGSIRSFSTQSTLLGPSSPHAVMTGVNGKRTMRLTGRALRPYENPDTRSCWRLAAALAVHLPSLPLPKASGSRRDEHAAHHDHDRRRATGGR